MFKYKAYGYLGTK